MVLSAAEQAIVDASKDEAKLLRTSVFALFCEGISPVDQPVLVMMSGAPAAGKTEVVEDLLDEFDNIKSIDPDSYRALFTHYDGVNSHLFQSACTNIVSYVYEKAIKAKYNVILDTNLIDFDVAKRNLSKAIQKGYAVIIIHVSLDPYIAWRFAQSRSRKILPATFKRNVFLSRQVLTDLLNDDIAQKVKLTVIYKWVDEQDANSPIDDIIVLKQRFDNADVNDLDLIAPVGYSAADLDSFVV